MTWTKIAKPLGTSYTNISKPTGTSYTNIPKPVGSVIATLPVGRGSALMIPLTFSTPVTIYGPTWININKPT